MNWSMDFTFEMRRRCQFAISCREAPDGRRLFQYVSSISAATEQMTPAEAELPGRWHDTSSVASPFHHVSHLRRSESEETQPAIAACFLLLPTAIYVPLCWLYQTPLFYFFFCATHLCGTSHWGMMRVCACCAAGPRFPFDWCSFSVSRGDERCSAAAKSPTFSQNIAEIPCECDMPLFSSLKNKSL